MTARYLHHVSLSSGRVRRSPRADVEPELRLLLHRALEGEHVPISGRSGYTMTGVTHGRCCEIELHRAGVRVLTVGVAQHSRCGAALWRHLHERNGVQIVTDIERVPPEPWSAELLELAQLPAEDLGWTEEWAQKVAWSWLEMRGS